MMKRMHERTLSKSLNIKLTTVIYLQRRIRNDFLHLRWRRGDDEGDEADEDDEEVEDLIMSDLIRSLRFAETRWIMIVVHERERGE